MMKQAWVDRARRLELRALLCAGGLSGVLWPAPAAAQDPAPTKASCAEAYESAQESRASGRLQETRQRLSFCAQAECPSFVQRDCARWLEEVERELPSVIVSLDGGSAAAADAQVKIDGQVAPDALNGHPLSLDPGRHELVVERPGKAPITRTIMAQQGVQNRSIELPLEQPAPNAVALDADRSSGTSSSPWKPYAYAAWGLGAIGFGTFAVMGTLGRADERGLERDCPNVTTDPAAIDEANGICAQSTFDERESDYKREFVIADVGLVTGIVGAAAGTALFIMGLTSPSEHREADSASLRFDIRPTRGGTWASVGGSF